MAPILAPGEVLFEPGDSDVPVYVVLSGGLDILQPSPKGVRTLVTHVPGSITGEFAVISGQRALLPAQFRAVAGSGSIYYGSALSNVPTTYELAPSDKGQLELLAANSIYAAAAQGPATLGMSGANAGVDDVPNPFKPAWLPVSPTFSDNIAILTIDGFRGYGTNSLVRITPPMYPGGPTTYTPTLGYFAFQAADTAAGVLHAGDTDPMRLYAADGDIVGAVLGASQPARTFGTPIW